MDRRRTQSGLMSAFHPLRTLECAPQCSINHAVRSVEPDRCDPAHKEDSNDKKISLTARRIAFARGYDKARNARRNDEQKEQCGIKLPAKVFSEIVAGNVRDAAIHPEPGSENQEAGNAQRVQSDEKAGALALEHAGKLDHQTSAFHPLRSLREPSTQDIGDLRYTAIQMVRNVDPQDGPRPMFVVGFYVRAELRSPRDIFRDAHHRFLRLGLGVEDAVIKRAESVHGADVQRQANSLQCCEEFGTASSLIARRHDS